MTSPASAPRALFSIWTDQPSPAKGLARAASAESWEAVFSELTRAGALQVADPLARPAWAGYVLSPSARGSRSNRAVEAYTCLVLDIDHATPQHATDVLTALVGLGCLAFAHTTWSYDPTDSEVRLRIVVPLAATLAPTRAANAQLRLASALSTDFDPSTKDESRIYFMPCRKPGAALPWTCVYPGPLLDWTRLSNPRECSAAAVDMYGRKLKKNLDTLDIGTAICRGVDGLPFAEEGSRDSVAWLIACTLHRKFPHADPVQVAGLFDRSVASMTAGAPDMREKMARAWATKAVAADEDIDRRKEFWARYGDPGRSEPYNSVEREAISATFGALSGVKWAVHGASGVHFLTHEGYSRGVPIDRAGLAALTLLSPAPIALRDEIGTPYPIQGLLSNHGTELAKTQWSLFVPTIAEQFDETTNTLTICRTPFRKHLRPVRSLIAEAYLHAMLGAEQAAIVTRWLSMCLDLKEVLPALYFWGPAGAGKGTFASALSAGWGSAGATLVQEIFEWSEALVNNGPICLIDESFPRDPRNGNPMTPEFRTLLGERSHNYKGKYKDAARILGCPRVIMTANHPHLLRVETNHSDDDIKAIMDRVLVFRVSSEGERFLQGLAPETLREFVTQGFIEHVMFLAQVPAERVGRFGIPNTNQEFRDAAIIGFGLRPLVCQWIVSWLETPRPIAPAVRVTDGEVYVRASGMHSAWDRVLDGVRRPDSLAKIADAVSALSIGPADASGWYRFDLGKLHAYVKTTGIMGPAVLESLLTKAGAPAAGGVVLPFPGPYGVQ